MEIPRAVLQWRPCPAREIEEDLQGKCKATLLLPVSRRCPYRDGNFSLTPCAACAKSSRRKGRCRLPRSPLDRTPAETGNHPAEAPEWSGESLPETATGRLAHVVDEHRAIGIHNSDAGVAV